MENHIKRIAKSKRIVIKVGSSTLTYENGKMNLKWIDDLAFLISDLLNSGREIVLVTSGAIAVGMSKLNMKEKLSNIPEKQAVAAVGQCELMYMYSTLFSKYGHSVGQVLLTKSVIEDEISLSNATNMMNSLIESNILPIVNENDAISIEEILHLTNFGDNDTLSAYVSIIVSADLLVLFTDTDGMYDDDPKKNPDAKYIPVIENIDENIEKSAGDAGSKFGTGGFVTKIRAAKIANEKGIDMIIVNGENPNIIRDILNEKQVGTLFVRRRC
ncbi:MAG: glutamate 5-kinase [Oscillospiraceae bacterium]|nr:glutamate 5-kinase [Oscillospiraceae bacterium]